MVITRSRKGFGLILICVILFSFLSGVAYSQDFTLPPDGKLLVIPRGESLLLPVTKPQRVAVTDPAIADVVIVSTEQVLVNGVGVGTTTLQVWESGGVGYYRVRVVPNPDALVAELRKQLGLPQVKVYMLNDNVILDGIVESNAHRERALKLASAYGQAIDLLQVIGEPTKSDLAEDVAKVIQRPGILIRAINDYIVLEGEASSLEERHRAEMLASTFSRPVLNFLEIPSQEIPMEVLAQEIAQHIGIHTIEVEVIAGKTFLLEGSVSDVALKERAAAIAHAFGRPVINLIQVEETSPIEIAEGPEDGEHLSLEAGSEREIQGEAVGDDTTLDQEKATSQVTGLDGQLPEEKDIYAWVEEMFEEMDDPDVSLRVIQDAVVLEGVLESEYARERILAIARLYPVRIVNLLQVKDQPARDLTQEREWLIRYINDPDVSVTLVGKTVLLEGEVASELSRRRAVAVTRALGLEVVDLLEIKADALEIEDAPSLVEVTDSETLPDLTQVVPDVMVALGEENLKVFELNGFIVIEGQVPNEFRKLRTERIAATFHVPLLTLIEVESPPEEESTEPTLSTKPAKMDESRDESGEMPIPEIDEIETKPVGTEEDELLPEEAHGEPEIGLIEEMEEAIGLPRVAVQMVKGAVILDGVVESDLEAQGAEAVAGLFAEKVINRLQVIPKPDSPGPSLDEVVSSILALPGVQVSTAGEKLLLEGVVTDQRELERAVKISGAFGKEVVNLIRVEAPVQVLLKVRVVEASRVDMERAGITWGSMERGVLIPDVAYIGEIMIGGSWERLLPFAAKLEGLIDEGKARLLAAPSLLTLSGKEAEFLSGGEIPVIVPKDGEMQILWKPYGVVLKILPEVVSDNAIEVLVIPEVSTLDWANGVRLDSMTLPALTTRRTETVIYIEDGTTFVISGLLASDESRQIHKVPLLGDLPIIGKLFRSEQFATNETELIFFVTPHILRGNEPAMDHDLWRDEEFDRREGSTLEPTVTPANSR